MAAKAPVNEKATLSEVDERPFLIVWDIILWVVVGITLFNFLPEVLALLVKALVPFSLTK